MEESKNELEDFQSDNKDFSGFMCHCRKMSRNPNKYHNNDFRKIAEQIYNQLRVNPDGNIVQFSKNIKDVEEDYETIRKYSKIIGEKNKDKHLRERKNIIEQKDKDKFRNEKVLIIEDESYQVEVLLLFVKAMGFGKKNIYIISKDNREFVEIDKVQIKCLSGFPNLQDLEQYIEVIDPHYIITDDDLGQNNYKGRDLFDSYPNIILVSAQDLSGVLPTKINFIMKSVPYKILEA